MDRLINGKMRPVESMGYGVANRGTNYDIVVWHYKNSQPVYYTFQTGSPNLAIANALSYTAVQSITNWIIENRGLQNRLGIPAELETTPEKINFTKLKLLRIIR